MIRMASLKKVLRGTLLGRRYSAIGMEGKENYACTGTPATKNGHLKKTQSHTNQQNENPRFLRRNTSITQSMRDVVGTVRQVSTF